jgi:hypothetical protein
MTRAVVLGAPVDVEGHDVALLRLEGEEVGVGVAHERVDQGHAAGIELQDLRLGERVVRLHFVRGQHGTARGKGGKAGGGDRAPDEQILLHHILRFSTVRNITQATFGHVRGC